MGNPSYKFQEWTVFHTDENGQTIVNVDFFKFVESLQSDRDRLQKEVEGLKAEVKLYKPVNPRYKAVDVYPPKMERTLKGR